MIFLPSYKFDNLAGIDIDFFSGSDLIIFDVDNTLVFVETTETKKEVVDWFERISNKYRCVCLSNSRTINKRKGKIEGLLGCTIFLSKYKKPFRRPFDEILKKYNLSRNNKIFMVGDKILPDILFGNLNGAKTVLVGRLTDKETVLVKTQRLFENFLLKFFALLGYNT